MEGSDETCILDLPDEILLHIAYVINTPATLFALVATCRKFGAIVMDERLQMDKKKQFAISEERELQCLPQNVFHFYDKRDALKAHEPWNGMNEPRWVESFSTLPNRAYHGKTTIRSAWRPANNYEVEICNYDAGFLHGPQTLTVYDNFGVILGTIHMKFEHGTQEGTEQYEFGVWRVEAQYLHDRLHGSYKLYLVDHEQKIPSYYLFSEQHYHEGLLHGKSDTYNPDGSLSSIGNNFGGYLSGAQVHSSGCLLDLCGSMRERIEYCDGWIHGPSITYNTDGSVLKYSNTRYEELHGITGFKVNHVEIDTGFYLRGKAVSERHFWKKWRPREEFYFDEKKQAKMMCKRQLNDDAIDLSDYIRYTPDLKYNPDFRITDFLSDASFR